MPCLFHIQELGRCVYTNVTTVMIAIIVYIAVGLVLGGIAATIEIWDRPIDLERAVGRGTFKSPKYSSIGILVFVAVCWPLLLIAMAM
jgi:hypothetical protein